MFICGLLTLLAPAITSARDIPLAKHYGGTLIWGVCTKPTIINPILTSHSISVPLLNLIFNYLVRLNSKGEIEPDLAERWDISSDGLVYTFYLRKGVKFHDGQECTAEDVKFTYDKIIDPTTNSPFRPSFELVKEFEAVDKYTFQIKLKQSSATFIYRLLRAIVPKHLLEGSDLKNSPFNFCPIGTGPFRFKEWSKDDQIILEYNPDYYEGRPYLDEIVVKVYPTVRDVWVALMRSEVDYAGYIEKDDYTVAKADPEFKTYAIPVDYYYTVFYNPDDPLLAEKRIRQAIAYGINRKDLIEKIEGGYGLECSGPFYPESLGFNSQVVPYEYNPEQSLALLAEAGWQDKDRNGVLEKEGEELELKVLVDSRKDIFKQIAMHLRQQLQEIGIKLKVLWYDDESMLSEKFLKQNKPNAHIGLFFAADPIYGVCNWSYKSPKKYNRIWIYHNRDVDRLFDVSEVTSDIKRRQAIYQKIYQLIYEDQPACFLYFPFDFHVLSNRFINTDNFFNVNMPVYTIKDWYINPQEALKKSKQR